MSLTDYLPTFVVAGFAVGINGAALVCAVLGARMPSESFRFASICLCWANLGYLLLFARWLLWI